MKRAQILVADIWACFQGRDFGEFHDIDKITMFADYRVPQILSGMGALYYSPSVANAIKNKVMIESGTPWEIQLRGKLPVRYCQYRLTRTIACSIWCVELIAREIRKKDPDTHVNAILLDFFLYDKIKELEAAGQEPAPHHRTRSIWY